MPGQPQNSYLPVAAFFTVASNTTAMKDEKRTILTNTAETPNAKGKLSTLFLGVIVCSSPLFAHLKVDMNS